LIITDSQDKELLAQIFQKNLTGNNFAEAGWQSSLHVEFLFLQRKKKKRWNPFPKFHPVGPLRHKMADGKSFVNAVYVSRQIPSWMKKKYSRFS